MKVSPQSLPTRNPRFAAVLVSLAIAVALQGCSLGLRLGPVGFGAHVGGNVGGNAETSESPPVSAPPATSDAYAQGMQQLKSGNPAGAIAILDQALQQDPNNRDLQKLKLLANSSLKAHQRDLEGAKAELAAWMQLAPQDAQPYYYRGLLYRDQGQDQAAIAEFDQALQRQPQAVEVKKAKQLSLAKLQFQQGNGAAAQAEMDQLIALDPKDAASYYYRGLLLRELGNEVAAQAAFDQALQLQPDFADAKTARNAAGRSL